MTDTSKPSLSYKDAGVDIDAGDALVERIKDVAKRTRRPEVMSGLGGFGALCQIPTGYKEPVLVSGTDGVGTKLKLAMDVGIHDTIGIDLVAMCVNDLLVTGAEPLFFLDYYATGALNVDIAANVVSGIGTGCEQAGCALVGGETAEMPGMYEGDDYDLAGFCVGVVEKANIIDGSSVKIGDKLIGINSSGPHSNGYSLVRKIIEHSGATLDQAFGDSTLGETLLAPTRIYIKPNTKAVIDSSTWQRPAIFDWLQEQGNVEPREMYRTFNCGIGMVMAVAADDAEAVIDMLTQQGEVAQEIGSIEAAGEDEPQVTIAGM